MLNNILYLCADSFGNVKVDNPTNYKCSLIRSGFIVMKLKV